MRVIAFVSTKGGVGKSTLSAECAVEAARTGSSVYLLDLDPQQSTAAWWRRRKGPDNPLLAAGAETVTKALRAIGKRNAARDVLIVDTPGSFLPVINDAIHCAHALAVVAQPSLKDLEGLGAAEGLIAKAGRVGHVLYVLNRVDPRSSLTRAAAAALEAKTVRLPAMIADRVVYSTADAAGKAANEVNKQAAAEISALWNALMGIADAKK